MKKITMLTEKGLTNNERKAIKIGIVKGFKRIDFADFIILVTCEKTEVGIAYSKKEGTMHRAVKNVDGKWLYNKAICRSNTTSQYEWLELPKTSKFTGTQKGLQMGAHVIAGICLGMYDCVDEEMIKAYEINHKDWDTTNNKPSNLELISKGDNTNHRKLKNILLKDNSLIEGFSVSAITATEVLREANGDIEKLKGFLRIRDRIAEVK